MYGALFVTCLMSTSFLFVGAWVVSVTPPYRKSSSLQPWLHQEQRDEAHQLRVLPSVEPVGMNEAGTSYTFLSKSKLIVIQEEDIGAGLHLALQYECDVHVRTPRWRSVI